MSRQEEIDNWAEFIIPAVFTAENNIKPKLNQILADYKDDRQTAAKLYARAIAEEIVSKMKDNEL